MTAQDYAALAVAIATVLGGVTAMLQFMVKHYLQELKPNSGTSMRDAISRLEANDLIMSTRIDKIYEILCDKSD
jgi:hypothetical protein